MAIKKKAVKKHPTKKVTKKPVKRAAKAKRKAPARPAVTPPDRPRLLTEPAPDPLAAALLDSAGVWPVMKAVPEEDYTLPEGWEKSWRNDRGIWENICPHGVGHPSDESVKRTGDGVHGCDGCCAKLNNPVPPPPPAETPPETPAA